MRRSNLLTLILIVGVLAFAATAQGDASLSVTSTAAMGSSSAVNNCTGDGQPGPCGLEVIHDGTATRAFVEDETPVAEQVYRASFYIDPNDLNQSDTQREIVFRANDDTQATVRVEMKPKLGTPRVKCSVRKNNGEYIGTDPKWVPIPAGTENQLMLEVEFVQGSEGGGLIRCTNLTTAVSGERDGINNGQQRVDRVRMGAVQGTDAGVTGTVYFDEFESFRTLAP